MMKTRVVRTEGDVSFVPLTRGREAVIDTADASLVGQYNWQARPGPGSFIYAVRSFWIGNGRLGTQRMHRLILGAEDEVIVDHINGDGLDNRRANIRICTDQQNARNTRIYSSNTSGAKGVYRIGDRFRAQIRIRGKKISLGIHPTLNEAAAAYDEAARRLFGDFAHTNNLRGNDQ